MASKSSLQTFDKPFEIMAIVNVTPDSFSDGGMFLDPKRAVSKIFELLESGSDWVDIGAESTRPGALPISDADEWDRLRPVFASIKDTKALSKISLDSRRQATIERALDCGVGFLNFVGDIHLSENVLKKAASYGVRFCATHMIGQPLTMQRNPLSGDVVKVHIEKFFKTTADLLSTHGFDNNSFYLDPGIGFGKDDSANWHALSYVPRLAQQYRVALGISRKSFLGRLFQIDKPRERDDVSRALEIGMCFSGASLIRTHECGVLKAVRDFMSS